MGTFEEIKHLKNELLIGLKKINLSQEKFAGRYYVDTCDAGREDDDREFETFIRKFKQQMKRDGKTSKVSVQIKSYLDFLYAMPEYKKTGLVPPRYIPYPEISSAFQKEMIKASKSIDRCLEEECLSEENGDD